MKKRIALFTALLVIASVFVFPVSAASAPTCNLLRQSTLVTASMGWHGYHLKITGYGEAYPNSGSASSYRVPLGGAAGVTGVNSVSASCSSPGGGYTFGYAKADYYYKNGENSYDRYTSHSV